MGMKKSKGRIILGMILCLLLVCVLTSCGLWDDNSNTDSSNDGSTEKVENQDERENDSEQQSQSSNQKDDGQQTQTTHDHAFEDWKVVKSATCTAKGTKKRTCSCGAEETEQINALGHIEVVDNAVAASCTQSGLTEGKHCGRCGEILKKQETISASHNAPYGICLNCNKVTDSSLAAEHYVDIRTNLAQGKTCTCYNEDGSEQVRFYVDDIDYTVTVFNRYDNKIAISVDFSIHYDILSRDSTYRNFAFLTYVIADNGDTIKSGSLRVDWGYSDPSCTIADYQIAKHVIYINIGNYYY